jgi:hypothetical protein
VSTPAARCAIAGYAHSALVFERGSRRKTWLGAWECHCADCYKAMNGCTVGTGRSALEALEEYARLTGTKVDDLLEPREKHV